MPEGRGIRTEISMIRVFLSGPMRGLPEFNHAEFHRVSAELRAAQFEVFSPAELKPGAKERDYLHWGLAWLCQHADVIALLDGWENSRGVRAEIAAARALDLPVMPYRTLLERSLSAFAAKPA